MIPLKTFREDFLREITLPEFGEDIDAITDENSPSPAAKELEETKATNILSSHGFLSFAHRSLRECSRLSEEQNKVKDVARNIGPSIKRLRDAQKTLNHVQEEISRLDRRLVTVLTEKPRERLDRAVKELEIVEDILLGLERSQASHVHPEIRKKHDKTAGKRLRYTTSGFRSLLPRFDYALGSLKKKAPMQWLIETLDSGLRRRFERAKIKVSNMTRYKIIAEAIVSGGLPETSANTIKQHFVEKRKSSKSGMSRFLCKRPGLFWDGVQGKGSFPCIHVEAGCRFIVQLSPGRAFFPATEC